MSEKKVKTQKTEKVKKDLKSGSGLGQLTVTLCGICAICALLLALTNMVTDPIIKENAAKKQAAAIAAEVLPGFDGTLTQVNYVGGDPTIKSVQKGSDGSFVVEVSPKNSFSGNLTLLVGIDANKVVAGISVTASGESPGLGAKASEPEFRNQFAGKTGTVAVDKDGGEIAAISGATITSRAVCDAVNSALEAIENTNDAPFDPSLVPATPEPVEDVALPGYTGELTDVSYTGGNSAILSVKQAGDAGYVVDVDCGADSFSKTLKIQVGINSDNTVAGVVILESDETEGFGAKMNDVDNRLQFRGLSGTLAHVSDGGEVEGITGATYTSKAVIKGINAALVAVGASEDTAQPEPEDNGPTVEKSDDGYAVTVDCGPDSFSKTLILRVSIDANKAVSGIEVVESNETEGVGSNALTEEHLQKYVGMSGSVEVDGIGGATYTSNAVNAGVNAALKAVETQG